MDYSPFSVADAPLYPPGLGTFFADLGTNHTAASIMGKEVLYGILFIFLFFYIIVSLALLYHWVAYGMRNKFIIFAEVSFTVVSVFLFWAAGVILFTL